jgi:hypothetical protein
MGVSRYLLLRWHVLRASAPGGILVSARTGHSTLPWRTIGVSLPGHLD